MPGVHECVIEQLLIQRNGSLPCTGSIVVVGTTMATHGVVCD